MAGMVDDPVTIEDARAGAGLAAVWRALSAIPDPEIPVVSIVDLGMVRGVAREGEGVVVRVTPTYSGCPATDLIVRSIVEGLAAIGVRARVEIALAPAWTTDWMSEDAKRRLREYGIAPPGSAVPGRRRARHQPAAPFRRHRSVPALQFDAHAAHRAVRVDRVQGALPLRGLPGAVRLLQAPLTDR
jgi:ring-1,2-phenylacetyl-CoA epoxidase subunit PaaD